MVKIPKVFEILLQIKEAEEHAARIIEEANSEAERIVANARKRATLILEEASSDALIKKYLANVEKSLEREKNEILTSERKKIEEMRAKARSNFSVAVNKLVEAYVRYVDAVSKKA